MAGAGSSSCSSLEVPDVRDWRQSRGDNTLTVPGPYTGGLYSTADPRSSSALSLVPSLPEYEEFAKRKLLIIYVHGFMGNDTSFQQFPLHVHRYIKDVLAETHVIHSKIYPRYKTYKAIDVARDNFSRWLEPHESPMTDVVLIGHSMGGLLAADVVLMPGQRSQETYFKHRILGAVHLDSPILGLHPGIVVSGISSLFRSKPEKPGSPDGPGSQLGTTPSETNVLSPTQSLYSESSFDSQTTMATSSTPGLVGGRTMDPNFDPSFPNDVRLTDRSWWKNVVHFAKKHSSEGLIDATTKHLMSHLEFGGCLMDYSSLKSRYENVRKLEDIDDVKNYGFPHVPPQVRFVQYYTVCYGFPKVPKAPKIEYRPQLMPSQQSLDSIVAADLAEKPDSLRRSIENPGNSTLNVPEIHTIPEESRSQSRGSVNSRSGSELEMLEPEPMPEEEPVVVDQKPETTHEQESTATGIRSSSSSILEPRSDISHPTARDNGEETSPSPPRIVKESATGTLTDLTTAASNLTLDLPAIPEPPTPPTLPDLGKVTDKDARKQAEKESKRLLKAYEQAVKDRNKAIKERDKIIEKRQKKLVQEAEKREKEAQKQARQAEQQRQKDEVEEAKKAAEVKAIADANEVAQSAAASAAADMPSATDGQLSQQQSQPALSPPTSPVASPSVPTGGDTSSSPKAAESKPKKLKERKFINLPSKINGQPDPKWVKIFMKDMDETAAHTSLFFLGEHYEKLVGDVGELLTQWVQDDLTKKAIIGYDVD